MLSLRAYDLRLNSIELKTSYEPGLPPVVGDAGQIQQALLNLILNAEQAMRGRATRRLTVAARFDEAASAIELSVTDTGHGIDDASLTRIFDPFFTTRDVGDGTGLGLSICYGIIRDHGGQILVESRVHVGTTFSILLPAKPDEPAPTAEPDSGRASGSGRAGLHRRGAPGMGLHGCLDGGTAAGAGQISRGRIAGGARRSRRHRRGPARVVGRAGRRHAADSAGAPVASAGRK